MTKYEEHIEYLKRVSSGDKPLINMDVYDRSIFIYEITQGFTGGRMPPPAACTGPHGEMFYSWDKGPHHLEVEITPRGLTEWFYRNRDTGEFYSLIKHLVPILELFCDAKKS